MILVRVLTSELTYFAYMDCMCTRILMYMISVFILIEMRELRLSNVIKHSSKVLSKYVAQLERPNVGNERESE